MSVDNEAVDKILRERERGDPMLTFIRKKAEVQVGKPEKGIY